MNYSLQASPPVELRLYVGDPDTGGVRIFPDAPGPLFTDVIPALGNDVVTFDWTIPEDLQVSEARIFAVIDAADNITDEIHESNNKAWAPLAIPVPEPAPGLAPLAALGTLLALRRSAARFGGVNGRTHR